MSMKRRVVYLSDEQWDALARQAQAEKVTISALIRDRAAGIAADVHRGLELSGDVRVEYDAKPVAFFTPVPKPGKRR